MKGQQRLVLCVSRSIAAKDRTRSGFSFTSVTGIAALLIPWEESVNAIDLGVSFTDTESILLSMQISPGKSFWSRNRHIAFLQNQPYESLVITTNVQLRICDLSASGLLSGVIKPHKGAQQQSQCSLLRYSMFALCMLWPRMHVTSEKWSNNLPIILGSSTGLSASYTVAILRCGCWHGTK